MDRPSDVVQREAGAATLPTLPGPIRCGRTGKNLLRLAWRVMWALWLANPRTGKNLLRLMACEEHLLLDPDTGLRRPGDNRVSTTHVTVDESIQIVGAQNRNGKFTLIYDQNNQRANRELIRQACGDKLQPLHNEGHHAVGYLAHQNVVFIWASTDPGVIADATRMMQRESRFPALRFVDDGCGHVW